MSDFAFLGLCAGIVVNIAFWGFLQKTCQTLHFGGFCRQCVRLCILGGLCRQRVRLCSPWAAALVPHSDDRRVPHCGCDRCQVCWEYGLHQQETPVEPLLFGQVGSAATCHERKRRGWLVYLFELIDRWVQQLHVLRENVMVGWLLLVELIDWWVQQLHVMRENIMVGWFICLNWQVSSAATCHERKCHGWFICLN